MNSNITRMLLGGMAGTLIMSLMMRFVAPILIGHPMDIAAMLGNILGNIYFFGFSVHMILGIIVFPYIYVILLRQILPGATLVKGLLFGTILWLIAETLIMPIAGAGFFMSEIGGVIAIMAALMGHWIYGGLISVITGKSESNETTFSQQAMNIND